MTEETRARLNEWREAFDRSFAEPLRHRDEEVALDVLGIRIAGAPFALNLADLAGLTPAMPAAPYPATAPGLLGLAGHQGQVLPLYDLQALIGRGPATTLRWWAIARAAPLALAFEGFDGQWRLSPGDRLQQNDAAGTAWAVRCGGALRPLIELEGVIAAVAGGQLDATDFTTSTTSTTTTTAGAAGR
ncbi:chemotaxis protein CheW [Mitsuaria sp. GD03876]|uniref:chemotaxis protein CheW n=1 Tax=Mitsuaria sp. GD03876 TaxID=2975399 RepID=UPI0024470936|nr:chemotaxis protein CheW [Mitsuaria sp. GD03876]MDH0866907.1 chemotaxis protein CheW [Mitsuaria sp. GD03876]